MRERPIGVFDSGIGGLTVVKEIIHALPHEDLIYLGDTARAPYGDQQKKTITKFALELTKFLLGKKVKAIVVACNTISATSLREIEAISPVPVVGVIEPTIEKALSATRNKKIGVIGTRATIESGIFEKEIKIKNNNVKIIQQACPLLVPLVEEGLINSQEGKLLIADYLSKFINTHIDTLILGCTHYPLLKGLIRSILDKEIALIDSAAPTAERLKRVLEKRNLINTGKKAKRTFYITDEPKKVFQTVNVFFDNNFPGKLEKVKLLQV